MLVIYRQRQTAARRARRGTEKYKYLSEWTEHNIMEKEALELQTRRVYMEISIRECQAYSNRRSVYVASANAIHGKGLMGKLDSDKEIFSEKSWAR